jgi:hypothetical protein
MIAINIKLKLNNIPYFSNVHKKQYKANEWDVVKASWFLFPVEDNEEYNEVNSPITNETHKYKEVLSCLSGIALNPHYHIQTCIV